MPTDQPLTAQQSEAVSTGCHSTAAALKAIGEATDQATVQAAGTVLEFVCDIVDSVVLKKED